MKPATVVLGTKMGHDSGLVDYITKDNFLRIESWPPKKEELKTRGEFEQTKLLLWPKMKTYDDLRKHAAMFKKALQDIMVEPNWCIGIDELLWACSPKGLDLNDEISAVAFSGASNGTSLHICTQRAKSRFVNPTIIQSCHEDYIFRTGNRGDIAELATYAGKSNKAMGDALQSLNGGEDAENDEDQGHEFLYASQIGSRWSRSEMPESWA
jgi:hypothetical protein